MEVAGDISAMITVDVAQTTAVLGVGRQGRQRERMVRIVRLLLVTVAGAI